MANEVLSPNLEPITNQMEANPESMEVIGANLTIAIDQVTIDTQGHVHVMISIQNQDADTYRAREEALLGACMNIKLTDCDGDNVYWDQQGTLPMAQYMPKATLVFQAGSSTQLSVDLGPDIRGIKTFDGTKPDVLSYQLRAFPLYVEAPDGTSRRALLTVNGCLPVLWQKTDPP